MTMNKVLMILILIGSIAYCNFCVDLKERPEDTVKTNDIVYSIITDNGYCSVVTRDAYGNVTESFFESDDLDDCISWVRHMYDIEAKLDGYSGSE